MSDTPSSRDRRRIHLGGVSHEMMEPRVSDKDLAQQVRDLEGRLDGIEDQVKDIHRVLLEPPAGRPSEKTTIGKVEQLWNDRRQVSWALRAAAWFPVFVATVGAAVAAVKGMWPWTHGGNP